MAKIKNIVFLVIATMGAASGGYAGANLGSVDYGEMFLAARDPMAKTFYTRNSGINLDDFLLAPSSMLGLTLTTANIATFAADAKRVSFVGLATATSGQVSISPISIMSSGKSHTNTSGIFRPVSWALEANSELSSNATAVPVPAAVWLLGSALIGLVGVARRRI